MLENDKILLRALEPADAAFLYAMENDASVWDAGSNIQPFSLRSLSEFIENQQADIYADKQLRLVICVRGANTPVGLVDLYDFSPRHGHAWVAIMVASQYQAQGIARQALQLVADYAFSFLHLRMLMSIIAADNLASQHLFSSAGYVLCGRFPNYYLRSSSTTDALCYQLFSE